MKPQITDELWPGFTDNLDEYLTMQLAANDNLPKGESIMKLTFSQARKRREQAVVRFCEGMQMVMVATAFILTVIVIHHNI